MAVRTVTEQEHARIAEAIRKAETNTAGEIYCVVARASDSYFFSAAFIVTASIMIISLAVAFALEYWWFGIRLPVFVAAQLLALAAALALLYTFPFLRMRLAPHRWQYMRAHDNALKQFLARNVHLTSSRSVPPRQGDDLLQTAPGDRGRDFATFRSTSRMSWRPTAETSPMKKPSGVDEALSACRCCGAVPVRRKAPGNRLGGHARRL